MTQQKIKAQNKPIQTNTAEIMQNLTAVKLGLRTYSRRGMANKYGVTQGFIRGLGRSIGVYKKKPLEVG